MLYSLTITLLLLLFACFEPIVCYNSERFANPRPDRTSYADASQLVENETYEQRFRQQFQSPYNPPYSESRLTATAATQFDNYNDAISRIFKTGSPADGLVLFNRPPYAAHSTEPTRTRDFVYPTDRKEFTHSQCDESVKQHRTYCTKDEDKTPQFDFLNAELEAQLSKFAPLFGEDVIQPKNVSQRGNFGNADEISLCQSVSRVIYPTQGISKDSTWEHIVNFDKFKQGVSIEECSNKDQACQLASFPNGYVSICKQQHIYRTLVTFDSVTKRNFSTNQILFPSCCVCFAKLIN